MIEWLDKDRKSAAEVAKLHAALGHDPKNRGITSPANVYRRYDNAGPVFYEDKGFVWATRGERKKVKTPKPAAPAVTTQSSARPSSTPAGQPVTAPAAITPTNVQAYTSQAVQKVIAATNSRVDQPTAAPIDQNSDSASGDKVAD